MLRSVPPLNFTVLAEEKQRNAAWCSNIIHDLEIIQQPAGTQARAPLLAGTQKTR
jgi:hypothetical protein